MTRLSNTQSTLLAAAAARDDLSLLPAPPSLKTRGAARDRVIRALLRRGLVIECAARDEAAVWRRDEAGASIGLRLTPDGLKAVGVDPASAPDEGATAAPVAGTTSHDRQRPGGKLGALLHAVGEEEGATLDELIRATGWQPHTARAALTRLRQRGFAIRLGTIGGRKAYRIDAQG